MAEDRKRGKRPRRDTLRKVGRIVGTILLIGLTTCVLLACFAAVYIKTAIMPQADLDLGDFDVNQTTVIYYTDKETGDAKELQTLYSDENRIWVNYEDLPPYLEKAAVAIEDKRFYKHNGVDLYRTAGAFVNMFLGLKEDFGASTITQQLIKNLTGYDEVTVKRKVIEIFRALEFDRTHSKEETIEWYLNYIYLGEGCRGVYTASYTYFGKNVSDLDLAECASLIAITNNPSIYSPYVSRDRNKTRQETILATMLEEGYITQEQHDQAVAEELTFQRGEDEDRQAVVYSWYVDEVIRDVTNDLQEEKGISEEAASRLLYSGGYKIYCCIDPEIQAAVDEVYNDTANLPYTSKTGQQMQSGIVIMDYDGNVVAMAGGMGEKSGSLLFNIATRSTRPPGSAIKPLSVYAPALDMGLITPATVYDDSPVQLLDGKLWPVNSFGYYRGLTTVYEALEDSVNTVAVRVLQDVTVYSSYEYLHDRFGITSIVAQREVNGQVKSDLSLAPLAMGGLTDGITPLEMTAAYATFGNNGVYNSPRTYSLVLDSNGATVLEKESESRVAIKESTAYYMNTMLKNVVAAGTGTEARFSGMTIAGKTGTTTSNYDRWFVGYTPYYTAAVWTGYEQMERMSVSGNPAAKLWKLVMQKVHEDLPNKGFQEPDGLVSVDYCKDSGKLATDLCAEDPRGSRVVTGKFLKEDAPTEYCDRHTTVTLCAHENEDGTVTYYQPGPYCPASSLITRVAVDYTRQYVLTADGQSAIVRDEEYLLSHYLSLDACPYHTIEEPSPSVEPSESPSESPEPSESSEPSESPAASQEPGFEWPWG